MHDDADVTTMSTSITLPASSAVTDTHLTAAGPTPRGEAQPCRAGARLSGQAELPQQRPHQPRPGTGLLDRPHPRRPHPSPGPRCHLSSSRTSSTPTPPKPRRWPADHGRRLFDCRWCSPWLTPVDVRAAAGGELIQQHGELSFTSITVRAVASSVSNRASSARSLGSYRSRGSDSADRLDAPTPGPRPVPLLAPTPRSADCTGPPGVAEHPCPPCPAARTHPGSGGPGVPAAAALLRCVQAPDATATLRLDKSIGTPPRRPLLERCRWLCPNSRGPCADRRIRAPGGGSFTERPADGAGPEMQRRQPCRTLP